ncbi:MAG: hypothetical protein M5U22_06545 [Thermoleophilia bacterium]|nr:hypothetical protein [Thermoleophilia bacterium]
MTVRQILYAMQFKGSVTPAGENAVRAVTSSPSTAIRSVMGDVGLGSAIESIPGKEATLESVVQFASETSFEESGAITFGDSQHTLTFSTVGQGYLGPSPQEGVSHGGVVWRLESGTGQFEGACGLITSNFTVASDGGVVDNQFGVMYVP